MHEPTFRKTLKEAGLNPYFLEMANIREQCSWVHEDKEEATEKAKKLVEAAVAKALLLEALEEKEVDVIPSCLVIGAGIAGIQAALDIAEAGFKVYLVEKTPSVGGHMAQLDKTFPTLDCSACILTPKMVDVANHPNIELMTYSQVEGIEGYVGNFKATIRKKARYVDFDKCTGCGDCADELPAGGPHTLNEFDEAIGNRVGHLPAFPAGRPGQVHHRPGALPAALQGQVRQGRPQVRRGLPGRRRQLRAGRRDSRGRDRHHHRGYRLRRLRRGPQARVRLDREPRTYSPGSSSSASCRPRGRPAAR